MRRPVLTLAFALGLLVATPAPAVTITIVNKDAAGKFMVEFLSGKLNMSGAYVMVNEKNGVAVQGISAGGGRHDLRSIPD